MSDYGMAQDILEEKGRLETEYANDIASLTVALEEKHQLRVSLEEKLDNIEESQNDNLSKIIKERDHAIFEYKLYKKERVHASWSRTPGRSRPEHGVRPWPHRWERRRRQKSDERWLVRGCHRKVDRVVVVGCA